MKLYTGLDVIQNTHKMSIKTKRHDIDKDIKSSSFKIKFGIKNEDDWKLQLYGEFVTYDKAPIDNHNKKFDTHFTEFGLDLIKGFHLTSKFSPFIQLGSGFGLVSVYGFTEDYISEFTLKAGTGIIYKATQNLELILGFDIQYRDWYDAVISYHGNSSTVLITETMNKFYVGTNFYF